MNFREFIESFQSQDSILIDNIVKNPEDQLVYHALADWLEENSSPTLARVFHELGKKPNAPKRLKFSIDNQNNNEFINYLKKNLHLLKAIYIPIRIVDIDINNNFSDLPSNIVTLLRSQGIEISFWKRFSYDSFDIVASYKNQDFRATIYYSGPVEIYLDVDPEDTQLEYYIENLIKEYKNLTERLYGA